jgi:RND family efflux transporter MFP subunit
MKAAVVMRLDVEYRQQAEIVKRHRLTAPFAGVISNKLAETGEWVETGTPVLDLVAIDQLRLDIQAPQEYFPLISNDTNVTVRLDVAPEREFTGKVHSIVPMSNPGARTFLVRVLIDNADNLMIPGMSAQAFLNIELKEQALLLPRDATIQHPDGRNTVWIVNNVNGRLVASEQQVQLGRSLSSLVIVRAGLNPGTLVVIRGNETLKDGQAVHILEQATAGKTGD